MNNIHGAVKEETEADKLSQQLNIPEIRSRLRLGRTYKLGNGRGKLIQICRDHAVFDIGQHKESFQYFDLQGVR